MLDRILIVDDDPLVLDTLSDVLHHEGFHVSKAANARAALDLLGREPHALMLSDIRMPEIDGMALLAEVRRVHPGTDVVLMTGFGSLDGAIDSMMLGAADYLIKPIKPREVIARIRSILQRRRLEAELHALQSELRSRYDMHNIVADSQRMMAVVPAVQRVRDSSEPVVLFGEEGSGRRFIARTIHYSGARRAGEFLLVDARVPPPGGIDALLFGSMRPDGRRRRGLLERAETGTVHVAALEALEPALQRKLGRVIETRCLPDEGRLEGGGQDGSRHANGHGAGPPGTPLETRLILSVDEPANELALTRRLEPELGSLKKLVTIHVPPLRHRVDDIPGLVAVFLEEFSVEHGRALRVGPRVIELLSSHQFPGNVRQLFAVLGHCAMLSIDGLLTAPNLERSLRQSNLSTQRPISDHLGDREYQLVLKAVQRNPGRLDQAARELGVSRTTLWRRMRKYGIRLEVH
jgi:two-component system response regulator HydG